MKKNHLALVLFVATAASISAQISFTNQTSLLTPANHFSGVAISVLDMNGDGLDDIARLDLGIDLNIQYQTASGQPFDYSAMIALPGDDTWGMCAADVDNDGRGDVLTGGYYNGVKIARGKPDGSFNIQNLTTPTTFVQGVNFADINNDGWLDAFVCHDDGAARIFGNNGDGTFTYQPNWIDLSTVPASDNSGNYGSVWSDVNNDGLVDLYIAHCRQGVNNASDPRRINQLFLNNGDGTYSQDITNASGLRIGAQSWTADFGDIDNDGDFDCFITNHDVSSQLLENDGSGHFTDISAAAGLFNAIQGGLPLQGVFRDFDNDGFVDILVAGDVQYIFRNNGDKTFSTVANPFNNNSMESFAIGDLNGDGFQDIYAGYAHVYTDPSNIPDALWMNNGNNNHFFVLNLRGQQSNRNGVGTKVRLYSTLGIQTREVRSGESYGISNSLQIHFGLGQVPQIDSVIIDWPSGVRDALYQPAADHFLTQYEGGCISPTATLVAAGPTTICTGQSVMIGTVESFSTYLWNTGDTTAIIAATAAGSYSVTVTNPEGCSGSSDALSITVDPVEIPTIAAQGDTTFCKGGAVTLLASPAVSYLWNNGATTQSIVANQSGDYFVATQGLCSVFNSAPIHVTALNSPAPTVTPDTILVGETATLVASGEQINWYASPVAPIALAAGDTLVTPALTQNTTYWLSNTTVFDAPNEFVGMENHQGDATSANTFNGAIIFDCFQPFVLTKTKVITAVAGERKIDLRNSNSDVLQTKTINIPVGTTIIDLDFDVPVGTDLVLTTDQTVNQASFGTVGPQLRRSNLGCAYPYDIAGVVSIKNSNFSLERYYYFYNWEVDFYGYECASDRIPVTVVVQEESSTVLPGWATGLRIFPNPTNGQLSIALEGYAGGELLASLKNTQGQTLQTRTFSAPAGNATFNTDLAQFPAGIYWLELAGKDGIVQCKIVVR